MLSVEHNCFCMQFVADIFCNSTCIYNATWPCRVRRAQRQQNVDDKFSAYHMNMSNGKSQHIFAHTIKLLIYNR